MTLYIEENLEQALQAITNEKLLKHATMLMIEKRLIRGQSLAELEHKLFELRQ